MVKKCKQTDDEGNGGGSIGGSSSKASGSKIELSNTEESKVPAPEEEGSKMELSNKAGSKIGAAKESKEEFSATGGSIPVFSSMVFSEISYKNP